MNTARRVLAAFALTISASLSAQQVPDRAFSPPLSAPAFADGKGPRLCLDEAHHNFHTLDDRFWAFGELARRDGFVVKPLRAAFGAESLQACDILVISNAQPNDEEWDTYPYPTPSAFEAAEIDAVHRWVQAGGSLLLIADHMPLAGAAAPLAAAFGVEFTDGFAIDGFATEAERDASFMKPTIFSRAGGTLPDSEIARGRSATEAVTSVRTFTGQAFKAPGAVPILVLPQTFVSLMPETAWQFDADTRRVPVGGWLQAAIKEPGKGRAAFFGEAAMFSAQLAGPEQRPIGMNAPGAEQNYRLVLNLLHWLAGAHEDGAAT